ncbi:hypothetical protein [Spiroplasma endosymbiont of Aspidapion aeneum]|uniref:hypothetical protein n=1 Tax=Spiroplasma endosymbiont of Aspidapion aeneum TaxID=3066276 RepID=UPI00313D0D2E
MYEFLLRRTFKNINIWISFISIVILNLVLMLITIYKTSNSVMTISELWWGAIFFINLISIFIMQYIIKIILVDSDIDYMLEVERQYKVNSYITFLWRFSIIFSFTYLYIILLLVYYFAASGIILDNSNLTELYYKKTVGYIAFLFLFSLVTLSILSFTSFIKWHLLRNIIIISISVILSALSISIFSLQATKNDNWNDYRNFMTNQCENQNYYSILKYNNSLLSSYEIKELQKVCNNNNFHMNLTNNTDKYLAIEKKVTYNRAEIIYNKNSISLFDIFERLEKVNPENIKYWKTLSLMSINFEYNNIANPKLQNNSNTKTNFHDINAYNKWILRSDFDLKYNPDDYTDGIIKKNPKLLLTLDIANYVAYWFLETVNHYLQSPKIINTNFEEIYNKQNNSIYNPLKLMNRLLSGYISSPNDNIVGLKISKSTEYIIYKLYKYNKNNSNIDRKIISTNNSYVGLLFIFISSILIFFSGSVVYVSFMIKKEGDL